MLWCTFELVHFDRVASAWLIKRFVDKDAEFRFIARAEHPELPAGATPFAIGGFELSAHDEAGTTFAKICKRYKLKDAVLEKIAHVVHSGVRHVLNNQPPAENDSLGQMSLGLLALADGLMLLHKDDHGVVNASMQTYDALYAHFRDIAQDSDNLTPLNALILSMKRVEQERKDQANR